MLKVIDYVILTVYVVDIFFQFITSYYNVTTGDEIFKPSMIASRYLFSFEFIIDFLSTFPFRYIESSS